VTSGGDAGTNGARPFGLGPWSLIALVGVLVAIINATSGIIEGAGEVWLESVIWEVTSAAAIIALAPFIGWAVRRWPPRLDTWIPTALIHLGLTVPFSLVHILAIWLLRKAAYAAVGAHYAFFNQGVALRVLYEWRKDVLVYAVLAAVWAWYFRRAEAPPPERPGDQRVEIRDGNTAVFLAPADILLVEAAGNYITFITTARNYLVRGTLAAWEARLGGRGFARVHRSRLVNRARIRALKPTPSGDVEITLDDGRTVLGSRRYRDALAGA
jgi:hypothetical protein